MEIERKFLVKQLPENLETYPSHTLEQAYLCTEPVVRVRRSDDTYILTYKSKGLMSREEYNLPLTAQSYEHLKSKADGNVIRKTRYCIPLSSQANTLPEATVSSNENLTIELDIFAAPFEGLILAEVEFETESQALAFIPPAWFGKDVTWSTEYHNSSLSLKKH